jgi:hypothetical protein
MLATEVPQGYRYRSPFIALAACTSFVAIGVIVAFSIARKTDDRVRGAPYHFIVAFVCREGYESWKLSLLGTRVTRTDLMSRCPALVS